MTNNYTATEVEQDARAHGRSTIMERILWQQVTCTIIEVRAPDLMELLPAGTTSTLDNTKMRYD